MAKFISNLQKNKAAVDTRKSANLGLKCVKMRLAAGLCPNPLGELQRSPDPLAAIGGGVPTSKAREGNGKGEGREGRKGRGEEGRTPVPDWESAKVATLKSEVFIKYEAEISSRVSGGERVVDFGKLFTETNEQKFSLGGVQCRPKICSHPGRNLI